MLHGREIICVVYKNSCDLGQSAFLAEGYFIGFLPVILELLA